MKRFAAERRAGCRSSGNTRRVPAKSRTRLTAAQIAELDPYQFMAELGKRVIHPGGRRSTEELLEFAQIGSGERILDVGCGVGTTAAEIAERFDCEVAAVDVDAAMLAKARKTITGRNLARAWLLRPATSRCVSSTTRAST